MYGNVNALNLLLSSGHYDVNAKNRDELTPLHIACSKIYTVYSKVTVEDLDPARIVSKEDREKVKLYEDIILLLIQFDANKNLKNQNGLTAADYLKDCTDLLSMQTCTLLDIKKINSERDMELTDLTNLSDLNLHPEKFSYDSFD